MKIERVDFRTSVLTLENIDDDLFILRAALEEAKSKLAFLSLYVKRDRKEKALETVLWIQKIIKIITELGCKAQADELSEKLELTLKGGADNE